MGIQHLFDDVLFVTLPTEPQSGDELERLNEIAADGSFHDVIVDFTEVKMLTSESICSLMILARYLSVSDRRLVFCNISAEIREIFIRTGLESIFTFVDDDYAAIQLVRPAAGLQR